MIPTKNFSSRGGATVRLIVAHTAEAARTAEALGNYFANVSRNSSSHVGIDHDGTVPYVDYDKAAWTLRSGNAISDNAELCAYAMMTRDQWLSTETISFWHPGLKRTVWVDNPRAILERTAQWIAERCRARGIPLRKLTPKQVAAGEAGVIGHIDWTLGMDDGSHVDPGDNFPWDHVMARAGAYFNNTEEDDMLDDERNAVISTHAAIFYKGGAQGDQSIIERLVEAQRNGRATLVKLDALAGVLSDDEANILAALRSDSAQDSQAVAEQLAPLLLEGGLLTRLSDEDIARVVERGADEQDRRARERANQEV
ncbi:Phage tail length tape-measure protein [Alloactinosynnema sp. L-07]|uniref:N-acetylmuramoyl-L-alanine amidase n=1 Tax=Alloactinosynnema sp. L-07 TaxID=1653480 RepID=UPI00065F04D5|nr:N-acetylmuramoyl-L-alanine amidase [Alloactinosynnema sp. L-07]CRK59087.1 Phage tail length tape-measure protein [Alloactinosynnema sp. L-07]